MLRAYVPRCKPLISLLVCTVRSSGSNTRANKKGERGHPFLVPFLIGELDERVPFTFTCAQVVEYRAMIEVSIRGPTPRDLSTAFKYDQSMRSNTFSASVNNII